MTRLLIYCKGNEMYEGDSQSNTDYQYNFNLERLMQESNSKDKTNSKPKEVSDAVFKAIVNMYGEPFNDEDVIVEGIMIVSWSLLDVKTYELKSIKSMSRAEIIKSYFA